MQLNKKEIERYSRQIILKKIGAAGQTKLLNSSALIVGAGGLGSPIALYLSALGVGKIGIIDKDKVEDSNLARQVIFETNDIKKNKASAAVKKLKKINPNIKLRSFDKKLTSKNINKIASNYKLIIDGSDNFETRFLINDYCLKNKKILISSAISKFDGQMIKFDFRKKGPCYRCFMPNQPDFENNCQTEGIFSPVGGIMGSLQANEVLKTILNKKNGHSCNLLIFDALKTEFRKSKVSINPKCINRC